MRTFYILAGILSVFAGTSCGNPLNIASEAPQSFHEQRSLPTLTEIIAHPRRADDRARDKFRHPQQTLEFFGFQPTMTVAEIWPGWYSDIIAPYMAAHGGTYTAILLPDGLSSRGDQRNAAFKAKYSDNDSYGYINYSNYYLTVDQMLPDNSQDMILTFRNVHNWMSGGYEDHAFTRFYKALKPGGILGVVEHRLPESATQDPKAKSGYVQESYMKALAAKAGFEFVESSQINANPQDIADHPFGVWTLPPRSRLPEENSPLAADFDPEYYRGIGESDRATLKFRKPVK